jgi:chromosomal replication initiation ATPase DnaA
MKPLIKLAIETVAAVYRVPESDVTAKSRCYERSSNARMVAMAILDTQTGIDRSETAKAFGRHKTSVIHALKRVKVLAEVDLNFRSDMKRSLRLFAKWRATL